MIKHRFVAAASVRGTILVLAALLPPADVLAQEAPTLLTSRRVPVQVTVSGSLQRYEYEGTTISETAFPVFMYVPMGRRFGLSLRFSQAAATGDNLTAVSGVTDVQGTLSYGTRLGRGSLVLNVGANLPSGTQKLTEEEFLTTIPLSYNHYAFRVRGFGKGFGVAPGLTWATPISRNLVVGMGASYLYKGSFRPLQAMEDDYTPGDELLLSGGLDFRLGRQTTLSGDFTYTVYQADRVGEVEAFGSGDRRTATLQFRRYRGFNELRLGARYRSRGKNEVLSGGLLVKEIERTAPNQFDAWARFRVRVTPAFHVTLYSAGRHFEETPVFSQKRLIDVGLMPDVNLSNSLILSFRLVYTTGAIEGFDAVGGLAVTL